jgi:heat shock protein HslJ/uncharacterized membrane protein
MRPFLLAALLAAGCTTMSDAEAPATETYRALGNEPFWSVTITDGRMTYESPDGPRFVVPAPPARPSFNGRRYQTDRLTLDITHGECSDGMSDRRYADTAMVIVDRRTMHGCGGEILAPASLVGTAWSIVEIDGDAVSGEAYHLHFDGERLSGRAGCNRFSGPYSQTDGRLTAGAIVATRMACPGPRMDHERRVLQLLGAPVQVDHPDGDTLLLSAPGGTIRLRRSI